MNSIDGLAMGLLGGDPLQVLIVTVVLTLMLLIGLNISGKFKTAIEGLIEANPTTISNPVIFQVLGILLFLGMTGFFVGSLVSLGQTVCLTFFQYCPILGKIKTTNLLYFLPYIYLYFIFFLLGKQSTTLSAFKRPFCLSPILIVPPRKVATPINSDVPSTFKFPRPVDSVPIPTAPSFKLNDPMPIR